MKRKLIKQIFNEWRSNLWIFIELILVSAFVFGLVFTLNNILYVYNMPRNFDIDRTYEISYGYIPSEHETFDMDAAQEPMPTQVYKLLKTIRNHPIVEAATMSFASNPYCSNSCGIMCRTDSNSTDFAQAGLYQISNDFPIVYKMKGINGETPEQLAAILKEGKVLVSKDMFENAGNLVNSKLYDSNGTVYTVGAIIEPVRRNDYYENATGFFMALPDYMYGNWPVLAVRIKPEFNGDVTKTLVKEIRSGNLYVKNVEPMPSVRSKAIREGNIKVRNITIIAIFVLFNLFLGVLGTFWLRSQSRTGEIAIRKVNGATHASILRRMLGESMIILTIAAAIGIPLGFLTINLINKSEFFPETIATSVIITYATVALMTLLGTLFPTMKAMRINPSEALKSE
ncbi:MAG: FtsX-like permease family protein [Muribaculum sp.]|nr:FtsX-like permease family protein [Muribaculum sp.]